MKQPDADLTPRSWVSDTRLAQATRILTVAGIGSLTLLTIRDPRAVNHDAALFLSAGRVPYRDFFELNPPLIMYISALPVALGKGAVSPRSTRS